MKKVYVFRVEVPADDSVRCSIGDLEQGFREYPFHLDVRSVEMRIFHEAEPTGFEG
jgi:hypothetical protein